MNKDFSKYQKIIDDFSGRVLNTDFEALFSSVAKNIPQTERFLLKMELKRLAAPCTRLIDLRGHVDGECKSFVHEGRAHFLDDIAIKVFTEAFARYASYTFGVYEAAMNTKNNFRVIYQREKSTTSGSTISSNTNLDNVKVFEKTQYPAKFYSFGPYHDRKEERINFAISVQLTLEDKKTLDCTSSDLSVSGCKFRISGIKSIQIGEKISLRFVGLEDNFSSDQTGDLTYEVKNITALDNMLLVGVERVCSADNKKDGFTLFLEDFIPSNKRRYKINLENTISALQSRGYEQFILPRSNELPIFIENGVDGEIPKYALTCNNNQPIYQYWQDENRYSTLYSLISPERLARLKRTKGFK